MDIVQPIPEFRRDNTAQHEERQTPAEYHLVNSTKKVKGHTLFSYNEKTGEWKVAPVRTESIVRMNGTVVNKTVVAMEPDCIYIQALNLKNAKKKLQKLNPQ